MVYNARTPWSSNWAQMRGGVCRGMADQGGRDLAPLVDVAGVLVAGRLHTTHVCLRQKKGGAMRTREKGEV